MVNDKWKLKRYDPVEKKFHNIDGEYDNEEQAEKAAQECLMEIERVQPTSNSGGQMGAQDRVFIISPEGEETRIFPRPDSWKEDLKDSDSFETLESRMGGSEKEAHTRSIQLLLRMLEFIAQNVKVPKNDAEEMRVLIKGEKYNKLMSLAGKIYKEQYFKLNRFSGEPATLLEKVLGEDSPLCACGAIARISELYILGGAKAGVKKYYCYHCERNF